MKTLLSVLAIVLLIVSCAPATATESGGGGSDGVSVSGPPAPGAIADTGADESFTSETSEETVLGLLTDATSAMSDLFEDQEEPVSSLHPAALKFTNPKTGKSVLLSAQTFRALAAKTRAAAAAARGMTVVEGDKDAVSFSYDLYWPIDEESVAVGHTSGSATFYVEVANSFSPNHLYDPFIRFVTKGKETDTLSGFIYEGDGYVLNISGKQSSAFSMITSMAATSGDTEDDEVSYTSASGALEMAGSVGLSVKKTDSETGDSIGAKFVFAVSGAYAYDDFDLDAEIPGTEITYSIKIYNDADELVTTLEVVETIGEVTAE